MHLIYQRLVENVRDGSHHVQVRIYRTDGALIHEESTEANIQNGSFTVMLGFATPLKMNMRERHIVGIDIDGRGEVRESSAEHNYTVISSDLESAFRSGTDQLLPPITHGESRSGEVSVAFQESEAMRAGRLSTANLNRTPNLQLPYNSISGLSLEMSLAAPNIPTLQTWEMAKYGRINVEYNNFIEVGQDVFGMAAQAMHVAHHLLLYSAGITTDVNGDGMFLMTLGGATYQTGNSRSEQFVQSPFMRIKYQSSQLDKIFAYSEVESTMHFRSYISGTIGLGLRLTPDIRLIGGIHHTEFVQPNERQTRIIEGFHGIINWGL